MMKHAILLAPIALVACATEPPDLTEPPEQGAFAAASNDQIKRAVVAAVGGDLANAAFTVLGYRLGTGACPRLTQDAQGLYRAEGGCTTDGGSTLAGAVTFSDPLAQGQPVHIQFDKLSSTEGWMLDGTVELEPDGDATLALSLALGGITARTEARITGCKVGCVYDAGSTIEVDGIGVTEASGTFAVQDMPTATAVHLRASDELSITHDGDCFVYAGAAGGRVCSEK